MEIYKDLNHDSGIHGFEIGNDYIIVWFKGNSKSYTYSYARAGQRHVDKMKKLAIRGDGLNSYIYHNVRFKYDR